MKLKAAIAIAVAGAFALPFAAQASADADKIIVAQQGGSSTAPRASGSTSTAPGAPVHSGTNAADRPANTPKAEAGATARGGFAAIDKNHDGHISRDEAKDASWENRFSELDKDNDNRLSQSEFDAMQAGAGASGSTGAPLTGGSNAADRKPSSPKQ